MTKQPQNSTSAEVMRFILNQTEELAQGELDDQKKHRLIQGYLCQLKGFAGLELAYKKLAIHAPEAMEKMATSTVQLIPKEPTDLPTLESP